MIVFALLLTMSACNNSQKAITKGWTVTTATSQGWSGGMPNSGTGTYYRIEIKGSGMGEVAFDTVWHGSRAYVPEVNIAGSEASLKFEYRRYPADRDDPMSEMVEDPPLLTGSPSFQGEALIIGRKNGKRFTMEVQRFEVLEYLDYP